MGGNLVWVVLLVSWPLVALVHELGHAAVALWCTEGPVEVIVGRSPSLLRARAGRLSFGLHVVPPNRGPIAFAQAHARFRRDDAVAYALAGPLANLALAAALVPAIQLHGSARVALLAVAAGSALDGVGNLVPVRRGDRRSDGRVVMDLLRKGLVPAAPAADQRFLDVRARWHAAVADGWSLKSEQRRRNLSLVNRALGLQPDPAVRESLEAYEYACAGWAWRYAEQSRATGLRAGLAEATARAVSSNCPPELLAGATAWQFLVAGGKPGLASPGDTDSERLAFLERGFDYVFGLREDRLGRKECFEAFEFGASTFDAEQLL